MDFKRSRLWDHGPKKISSLRRKAVALRLMGNVSAANIANAEADQCEAYWEQYSAAHEAPPLPVWDGKQLIKIDTQGR